MMRLSSVRQRYLSGSSRGKISDDSARDFIYMVEHGISIDTIIEIMNCNDNEGGGWKFRLTKKLISNPLIRQNELFCVLLGVKSIKPKDKMHIIEINEFHRLGECVASLELDGYTPSGGQGKIKKFIKKGFVSFVKKINKNLWEVTRCEEIHE